MQNLRKTQFLVVSFTVAALLPFLNRAFHVDDPLFIWIARQIVKHPSDPYGFNLNWVSFTQPMSIVMQNPPLCSYYIAAVAIVSGWSERSLHLAFLVWAVLSVLGTFAIARRFCRGPVYATLLTLFTPAFLVSATSVMCDVMMLAFWVWALEFWLAGLDRQQSWRFLVSALLISAAALTKYFGITLVPLLAVYTLARTRRFALPLVFLLIPIAVLSNYDFFTEQQYGHGLFSAATTVSSAISSVTRPSHLAQLLIGLAFTGGCFFSAIFFWPLFEKRLFLLAATLTAAFTVAFKFFIISWVYLETSEAVVSLQGGLFAAIGTIFLVLAIFDLIQHKNTDSLLLLLWIFGTFFFATFFNWSITARTLLPMTPAVVILTIRQFERQNAGHFPRWRILPAAISSLVIVSADYQQANCGRTASHFFEQRYRNEPHTTWFQDHWGFQYYMEQWGAKVFDRQNPRLEHRDMIVGPFSDVTPIPVSAGEVLSHDEWKFRRLPYVSTSALGSGASFYSSFGGPLPWVVNKIPPERYYSLQLR